MDEHMTTTETARLLDWLTANGHTMEEAAACIKYLATGISYPDPDSKQD